jgi:hypothetical protein
MPDLRRVARVASRQRGKALIGDRSAVTCTVRDLSPLGARLSFSNPTFLPRRFLLQIDGEEERNVTVIWQAGVLAGVRFATPLRPVAPPRKKKKSWSWLRG